MGRKPYRILPTYIMLYRDDARLKKEGSLINQPGFSLSWLINQPPTKKIPLQKNKALLRAY